jgi:hypothetical protein
MATKPSPYTFINDTDGLGNTANVISVQQNANNTNTLIATYTQNNLDNNPQLQILNSAGGANGQIQFNNSRGFGGSSNLTYTESTSRLQLRGNLYVTGNLFANIQTNLNNFHLTGGANGYVLTTDGTGNVNWISPDPNVSGSLYNGNSNVIVHSNGNITFSSNGVANVVTISSTQVNLGNVSKLKISGGNATNYLTTDGNGNLYWADDVPIYIGNNAPNLPQGHLWFDSDEGRAYINYDGNTWVDLSPAVMPNPDIFANTITFPDGSIQTTAGGGGGNNPFNQSLNTTDSVTFSSVSTALGFIAQINGSNPGGELVIQTGGSKNWSYLNNGTLTLPFDNYLETTNIDLKAGSQGNVFIRANAAGGANIQTWNFDKTGNITFPDNTKQRTAFTGFIAGANVTGVVGNSARAATVTTNAQPNITSVGTLTSLSVTGNVSANFFIGNGSQLTGITSASATTVTANAQPNITSVGNLSSLSVTGNIRTGNLIVTSNTESISPSSGSIHTAGGIGAQGNIISNTHLYVGPGASLTAFNNPVIVAKEVGSDFIQAMIINSSDTGSSDWVAQADNGTDSGGWADLGFTSSAFNDANYTVTGPNDGYLFVQAQAGSYGGNLVLATGDQGTTNDIIFATGGFLTSNIYGRINHSTQTLEIPSGKISVGGNVTAGNLLTANIKSTGSLSLVSNSSGTSKTFVFDSAGNLTFPNGSKLNFVDANVFATDNTVVSDLDLRATSGAGFYTNVTGYTIRSNGSKNWLFDTSGDLNLPANASIKDSSGIKVFDTSNSGDEGGEIKLIQAPNSTLSGDYVVFDQYIDKVRFFESGGTSRGAYIDVSLGATSAGTLLNNRVTSGYNNNTPEVTIENFKAGINGSSQPYIKSGSGSFTCYWTTQLIQFNGVSSFPITTGGGQGITITTSGQTLGYTFAYGSDTLTGTFNDTSSGRIYRVTWIGSPTATTYGSVTIEKIV